MLLQGPEKKVSHRGRRATGNVGESILDVDFAMPAAPADAPLPSKSPAGEPSQAESAQQTPAPTQSIVHSGILFGYAFMHIIMPLAFSSKLNPV